MIERTGGTQPIRAVVAGPDRRSDDPVVVLAPAGEGGHPRLTMLGAVRAVLAPEPGDGDQAPVRLLVGPPVRQADGSLRREVVVSGWRFEVATEPEARAELRERATRAREGALVDGPLEIRAIIPGRIIAVAVAVGDEVTAGHQVLVLEAMKMQNELRAPRDGTVDLIAVGVGDKVEVGDLLLVVR